MMPKKKKKTTNPQNHILPFKPVIRRSDELELGWMGSVVEIDDCWVGSIEKGTWEDFFSLDSSISTNLKQVIHQKGHVICTRWWKAKRIRRIIALYNRFDKIGKRQISQVPTQEIQANKNSQKDKNVEGYSHSIFSPATKIICTVVLLKQDELEVIGTEEP
eukprot:TRINITY_DN6090_c0_g1_i4.p1 TRINITY_DN6090_c0_g1~~TRINITY_DN6090_c0_g1_i4.p1  ORF type:complete len:161 (-),score=25.22 TRINITY_DN6090_c0_g1_i4:289-771(-)